MERLGVTIFRVSNAIPHQVYYEKNYKFVFEKKAKKKK